MYILSCSWTIYKRSTIHFSMVYLSVLAVINLRKKRKLLKECRGLPVVKVHFIWGGPGTTGIAKFEWKRIILASRFAKKYTQHEKFSDLFPKTENPLNLRNKEEYIVKFANKQKLYKSAIPTMQRLLYSQSSTKWKALKQLK